METSTEPQTKETAKGATRRKALLTGLAGTAALAMQQANAQERRPTEAQEEVGSIPPEKNAVTAGPVMPGRGSHLTGKVAVVTGAARGIGRAIAVEMAANGADIAAIDICGFVSPASNAKPATSQDLDETARQVRGYGRKCMTIIADIRDIKKLRQIADQIEQEHGKIDIVVADAAIQRWKPLLEMDDADWYDVIDNNLNGTANTIRAFAPKLVARKYGRIIVLSSMQGKHGTKNASSYSASKWGILGLMKSAAMELGQYGITVNALLPGLVDTPLTAYPARFRNLIGEARPDPPQIRQRRRRGMCARIPCHSALAGLSRRISRPPPSSWLRMPRLSSRAPIMKLPEATVRRTCECQPAL